jgi:hypothetical protein
MVLFEQRALMPPFDLSGIPKVSSVAAVALQLHQLHSSAANNATCTYEPHFHSAQRTTGSVAPGDWSSPYTCPSGWNGASRMSSVNFLYMCVCVCVWGVCVGLHSLLLPINTHLVLPVLLSIGNFVTQHNSTCVRIPTSVCQQGLPRAEASHRVAHAVAVRRGRSKAAIVVLHAASTDQHIQTYTGNRQPHRDTGIQ